MSKKEAAEELEKLFLQIFGDIKPMPKTDTGYTAAEYEDYCFIKNIEEAQKRELFYTSDIKIALPYYDAGGILLRNNQGEKLSNCMILAINEQGTAKEHSESLSMQVDVDFIENRFDVIPKQSIVTFDISQHKCANPDCRQCSKKTDMLNLPYTLCIGTMSGLITIAFNDFANAYHVLGEINKWVNSTKQTMPLPGYNKTTTSTT